MNVLQNGLVMLTGTFAATFFGTMQSIIIARWLGPAETGQFQLVVTINTFICAIFIFGMGAANIYFISHHKANRSEIIANGILFSFATGALASIATFIAFVAGKRYIGDFPFLVAVVFSSSGLFVVLRTVLGPILIAEKKTAIYNISLSSLSFFSLFLIFCFYVAGALTVYNSLLALFLAQAAAALLVLYFLKAPFPFIMVVNPSLLTTTLKHGMKLYTVNLMMALDQNLALMAIGFLMPGEMAEVGYFSRAVAICALVRMLPMALSNLLYAHWSEVPTDLRVAQAEKALRLLLLLGLITWAAVLMFGSNLIVILYGAAFLPASPVLHLLIIHQVLWMLSKTFQAFFAGSGCPTLTTRTLLITTVIAVAGMAWLVPGWGIIGAGYAMIGAQVVGIATNVAMARSRFGLSLFNAIFLKRSDLVYIWKSLSPFLH